MIDYKDGVSIYTGDDLKVGATRVILNKLFALDGMLSRIMIQILQDEHKIKGVKIAIFHHKAMAFCRHNEVMAYCSPYYRRNGFATKCVTALKLKKGTIAYSTKFQEFWKHQTKKIKVINND